MKRLQSVIFKSGGVLLVIAVTSFLTVLLSEYRNKYDCNRQAKAEFDESKTPRQYINDITELCYATGSIRTAVLLSDTRFSATKAQVESVDKSISDGFEKLDSKIQDGFSNQAWDSFVNR